MKQYKMNDKAINGILFSKMLKSIPRILIALCIASGYAYYFPRGTDYDGWQNFFNSPSTTLAGALGAVALFIGYLYGFVAGRSSLKSLVITVTKENVIQEQENAPVKTVAFDDMGIQGTSNGFKIISLSTNTTIEVPKEISEYRQLEILLKGLTKLRDMKSPKQSAHHRTISI